MSEFKFAEEKRNIIHDMIYDVLNLGSTVIIDRIESIINERGETDGREQATLPCGCSPSHSPVFWNPYNNVVQCHRCGATYEPKTETK